ncbi:MAG: sigma-70 family RNA polymerase sigma factor [Planctomycetes bacterium]|nr:sigma-70 family RNA polymerase sigma factor [Planctomycetota bacterium]
MSEPREPPPPDPDFEQVYDQLRRLARQMLADQRPGHTLQATALVNEAFLRLQQGDHPALCDKAAFPRVAARAMRNVLVDHARARGAQKRLGRRSQLTLDAVELASQGETAAILEVDEAIETLRTSHPHLAELVQLRFFAGLTIGEVARTLGQSERTVYRDWTYAKALLLGALDE